MTSFQQGVLSLQAQFNSFYLQLENKKGQSEEKAVLTEDNLAFCARMQQKVTTITEQAGKEKNPAVGKVKTLFSLLQAFADEAKRVKGVEALSRLHHLGTGVKQAIQEIYTACFQVANVEDQAARVNGQNDEVMAGNDFIVQRACNQAQGRYPKSYNFFIQCIKEVKRGLCGLELQEALETCMPSIWSIEALLKLALVRLSQKEMPLSSLDCFVLDEQNLATFSKIATALKATDLPLIEQFLLHSEKTESSLQECLKTLNRFVEASVIERSLALGIMNLLQKRLSQAAYLDQIELLIEQKNFSEAIAITVGLSTESQRLDAICLLIHHVPNYTVLERLKTPIFDLENEEFGDDALECYVRKILDSFPLNYREAKEMALRIADPDIKTTLIERLAKATVLVDPAFCLSACNMVYGDDRNAILKEFIEKNSKVELVLCSAAFKMLSNQPAKKEALVSMIPNLTWVSTEQAPEIAKMIVELCNVKVFLPVLSKMILGISAYNPQLALLLALEAPEASLKATVNKKMHALIEAAAGSVPVKAMEAANRFKSLVNYPPTVAKIIQVCAPRFPDIAIELYSLSHEIHDAFSQDIYDTVKQNMKTLHPGRSLKLLQAMPVAVTTRDALFVTLVDLSLDTHPEIAYEAIQGLSGSVRKLHCLGRFTKAIKWEEKARLVEIAERIQSSDCRSQFLCEAVKRMLPINFSSALELCRMMPEGPQQQALLLEIAKTTQDKNQAEVDLIMSLIQTIKDQEARKVEMGLRPVAMYRADKEQALELLPKIENSAHRDKAYALLIEHGVEDDPYLAFGFIEAICDLEIRNSSLACFAEQFATRNWRQAVSFVGEIKDQFLAWRYDLELQYTTTGRKLGYASALPLPAFGSQRSKFFSSNFLSSSFEHVEMV